MTTTHDVSVGDVEVVKQFRSAARAEADREWAVLSLLHEHAPGLGPEPLRRSEVDGRPVIVMSRLPGEPLGGRPLRDEQVAAVVEAREALHAVAATSIGPRFWTAGEVVATLRGRTETCDVPGIRRALAEGRRWLSSADADRLAESSVEPVLGHGDGNLANVLWDGRRCRLVDFEDAGSSDRAFEYADLVEHLVSRSTDAGALLEHLALDPGEVERIHSARRLMALYWLVMLLPGNPAAARNPPATASRQASRLLGLLR